MDLAGRRTRTGRWRSRGKRLLLAGVGVAIGFNGVAVAASPGLIPAVYGVPVDDADTTVLLRHRAVLLALIGSLVVASALRPPLRPAVTAAAAASMATYALFAFSADVDAAQ